MKKEINPNSMKALKAGELPKLKATELRVGNIINYDHDGEITPVTVSFIGRDSEGFEGYYLGLNNEHGLLATCIIDYDFTMPIPLTEEWLLKLGFDGGSIHFDAFRARIKVEIRHEYCAVRMNRNNTLIWLANINHVHQLQNLYFALTNTELTLNDKR